MTIADLFKELHDTAKERIKNPILGAFICSFLVCNWQAFFIMLFSDMSIEERIEFMNTKWKVLLPIIVSLGYTLLVPLIMIGLDYALMPMKRKRISNIYENKGFTTDKKIKLAEKEYDLKNVESGNKEKQALLDQIESLKESNAQLVSAHKTTVEQLNASLQESSEAIQSYSRRSLELRKEITALEEEKEKYYQRALKLASNVYYGLSKADTESFGKIFNVDGSVSISRLSTEEVQKFMDLGLIDSEGDRYVLTSLGRNTVGSIVSLPLARASGPRTQSKSNT